MRSNHHFTNGRAHIKNWPKKPTVIIPAEVVVVTVIVVGRVEKRINKSVLVDQKKKKNDI